jgi:hypothetical protein
MRSIIVTLIAIASLTPSAVAQTTWVVDDDGPADFTALWKAVDQASDGDVVLVREGGYEGPIRIEGKSLTLHGEGDVLVYTLWPAGSPIEIRDLQAGQAVHVRGLSAWLFLGAADYPPVIDLEDNAGAVWIEDCELDATANELYGGSQVRVRSCASVTLSRCRLAAPVSSKHLEPGTNPWFGLEARDSRVFLYGCEVQGSNGLDTKASEPTVAPGTATAGIGLFGSTLYASGCAILGGAGGGDPAGLCAPGEPGAPALRLDAGASVPTSLAILVDTMLQGGTGGAGGCGHPDGADAAPTEVLAGSLHVVPGAAPAFHADSPVDAGAVGGVHVEGTPGDVALLLVSDAAGVAAPVPGLLGALHVSAASASVLVLGALPPSGVLEIAVGMPVLLSGHSLRLVGQALLLGPSGAVDAGTSLLLITDPAL